jgi:hypothetical protein
LVSCSLMMWSWLRLCSATADLFGQPDNWPTDRGFRNVGKSQSDAGEIPKRTHTRYKIFYHHKSSLPQS